MVIVIMGVSGSGKTKIGTMLAQDLGWDFQDADDFHSPANIAKMSQGIPLQDEDRAPWLQALGHAISQWLRDSQSVVLACSALKASYRRQLYIHHPQVKLVYLKGSRALLMDRLSHRQTHFLNPDLLASQLQTLEEPHQCLQLDISQSPDVLVQHIHKSLAS